MEKQNISNHLLSRVQETKAYVNKKRLIARLRGILISKPWICLKFGEDVRWSQSQTFRRLVRGPDAVSSGISTGPWSECPVGWVGPLKPPSKIKNKTQRRKGGGLCCLHQHNSWSEDHPVLQDEGKRASAKRVFTQACVSLRGLCLWCQWDSDLDKRPQEKEDSFYLSSKTLFTNRRVWQKLIISAKFRFGWFECLLVCLYEKSPNRFP